jgi:hypothetical protein
MLEDCSPMAVTIHQSSKQTLGAVSHHFNSEGYGICKIPATVQSECL